MTALEPLPPWHDDMGDGCSAIPVGPLAIRRRFNAWIFSRWPEAAAGCARHDEPYYYGGSPADRLKADRDLMVAWQRAGIPTWIRRAAYIGIRIMGRPGARLPGVSWAFGGGRFRYTERTRP